MLKQIVRYCKATRELGLLYQRNVDDHTEKGEITLRGFTDAAYNCDPDEGKSHLGHFLSINNNVWKWQSSLSKTQPLDAQHAEIVSGSKLLRSIRWATYLLQHCHISFHQPVPFHTDSKSKIATMESPRITKRTNHIRPKYFDLRAAFQEKLIEFVHTPNTEMTADILTKSLNGMPFITHRTNLSVAKRAKDDEVHNR
jgi:hypothetical protein